MHWTGSRWHLSAILKARLPSRPLRQARPCPTSGDQATPRCNSPSHDNPSSFLWSRLLCLSVTALVDPFIPQSKRDDRTLTLFTMSSTRTPQAAQDGTGSLNSTQTQEDTNNELTAGLDSSPRANPTRTRTLLGLKNSAPIVDEHQDLEHHDLLWSRIRLALREPFAEFFGTFIMVMFGDGSVAQVLLSAGQVTSPGKDGYGSYQSISWGYGGRPVNQHASRLLT